MYDAILHILGGCYGGVPRKKNEQDSGHAARRTVWCMQAMPRRRELFCLALNSQAHDFSMRAQLPVQIGQAGNIARLHASRA